MKQVSKQMLQQAATHSKESQMPSRNREQSFTAAQKIWEVMTSYYTDKWTSKNGATPSSIWITEIGLLSDEQIRKGIVSCRDKIRNGDQWPPDLSEFLALIHGHTDIDYHAAFMRCISKEPKGRVELWVYENAGWNIRTASHDKAERTHKKFMLEAMERERNGKLKTNDEMLKALPVNSVKNDNDIAIEKFEEKNGKKLHPRIAKLLGEKK